MSSATNYSKLSILMPVYNEIGTLAQIIERVQKVKVPLEKEIVIVDDGSKDGSSDLIKNKILKKYSNIIFLQHEKNYGKGRAVKTALKNCTGDIILIQDSDLEYDPSEYLKLIGPILDGKTKIVYGSRYSSPKGHFKENNHLTFKLHFFGNKLLSFLTSAIYNKKITDMETCYKIFTRDVINNLTINSDDFGIEPEMTAKFLRNKYDILEVPINYYSRDYSEGKKITWRDGIKALYILVKYRLVK